MTKEEARLSVIGAISMALKDPTLQQGFEIICKNLTELETENAELKASKPQWHDLRKDPNDLPKKNKSYWVHIDCQGNKIYRSIVWQGCWLGWDCIPLAWCEEPTFDKEDD